MGSHDPADDSSHAAGTTDTERRQRELRSERSFRSVVEWSPSAMLMVDKEGRIVLVNAAAEDIFGCPRSELVGRPVEQLVPPRFSAHHAGFRDSFFSSPTPRPMGIGRDLFARRSDGNEFPVEIGLNPIETEDGLMVLASIFDITERKRAQERLEMALEEKTVLLNELHHRVKNNLQMISSLLSLQASNSDDERLREVLRESQNRVKAMGLTHQLLYEHKDFSRVDLGEYLNRLAQLLLSAYRGGGRNTRVELVLPAERHYVGLEKAIPCGLAVNELVTNSFKHAFPDGRPGVITVALAGAGDNDIELSVGDDGVGLPEGFEMGATKSLGLRLVLLLAEQLQGALAVQPGGGAVFLLRFPAGKAAD
ncbi:MAG TPA: histidine kinase dimerization/phosphoacceptor domain -containing protein [Rhodocyclaceae bacterium]|nr:histidine kinase dimerization/phosphoacceptor domain -containing protein [Rhodocyclaceae bacterium]